MLLFKLVVVILLIFIVISLFTALYHLNKTTNDSTKVVKTLAIRIGLSLFLFILIGLGYLAGLVELNNTPF